MSNDKRWMSGGYCTQQVCTIIWTHIGSSKVAQVALGFIFVYFFGFSILCVFCWFRLFCFCVLSTSLLLLHQVNIFFRT